MGSDRKGCVVLGIGNAERGDDAAGLEVARRLRGAVSGEVEVAALDGDATDLLERFEGAGAVFVVDACRSGSPPGTVHRFDVGAAPLPTGAACVSSHGIGLAEVVELARVLGRLPSRCIVYAIEIGSLEMGAPLSPPVAVAVLDVAERLRSELTGETAVPREG